MRKPRKNYTPIENVAIFRHHLIGRVPISNLCDEYPLQLKRAWETLTKAWVSHDVRDAVVD